jgi:crotonobetainyl-CoA:carnitine CoA-transferase CaiB-like acyl-CoA transferase
MLELDLRVLDLVDESGSLCGRILADLGADVIKVEPPGGDPGRRVPPFADDRPEPDRSLAWLANNVNKRGITCDLRLPSGQAIFRRLAEGTDVVVETFPPGELDECGLGYAALASSNPGLVLTSITPFGLDGPGGSWPASDL